MRSSRRLISVRTPAQEPLTYLLAVRPHDVCKSIKNSVTYRQKQPYLAGSPVGGRYLARGFALGVARRREKGASRTKCTMINAP